jgi:hypothetical protein
VGVVRGYRVGQVSTNINISTKHQPPAYPKTQKYNVNVYASMIGQRWLPRRRNVSPAWRVHKWELFGAIWWGEVSTNIHISTKHQPPTYPKTQKYNVNVYASMIGQRWLPGRRNASPAWRVHKWELFGSMGWGEVKYLQQLTVVVDSWSLGLDTVSI